MLPTFCFLTCLQFDDRYHEGFPRGTIDVAGEIPIERVQQVEWRVYADWKKRFDLVEQKTPKQTCEFVLDSLSSSYKKLNSGKGDSESLRSLLRYIATLAKTRHMDGGASAVRIFFDTKQSKEFEFYDRLFTFESVVRDKRKAILNLPIIRCYDLMDWRMIAKECYRLLPNSYAAQFYYSNSLMVRSADEKTPPDFLEAFVRQNKDMIKKFPSEPSPYYLAAQFSPDAEAIPLAKKYLQLETRPHRQGWIKVIKRRFNWK